MIGVATGLFRAVFVASVGLIKYFKGKKKKARQRIVESRKPRKMGAPGPSEPTVFISYSHEDEAWKDRLRPQLKALEQAGLIAVWDDRRIDPGGKWYDEINDVMERAKVAVCLISPDYLASEFCVKEEIPYLIERRERQGMALILVLLRPCAWEAFPWLSETQMVPRDGDLSRNSRLYFFHVLIRVFGTVCLFRIPSLPLLSAEYRLPHSRLPSHKIL